MLQYVYNIMLYYYIDETISIQYIVLKQPIIIKPKSHRDYMCDYRPFRMKNWNRRCYVFVFYPV